MLKNVTILTEEDKEKAKATLTAIENCACEIRDKVNVHQNANYIIAFINDIWKYIE